MLRGRDLLLTLAAAFLLVAALNRRSCVGQASALAQSGEPPPAIDSQQPQNRYHQAEHLDRVMQKIKQNTLRNSDNKIGAQKWQAQTSGHLADRTDSTVRDSDHAKQNSYHHFASQELLSNNNQTAGSYQLSQTNRNSKQPNHTNREPQAVRLEFLRSANTNQDKIDLKWQEKGAKNRNSKRNSEPKAHDINPINNTLYMLNYPPSIMVNSIANPITSLTVNPSPLDKLESITNESDNEVAEQQQEQQPFNLLAAILPQFQQLNPVQQAQLINQLTPEQQANVRQILAQYGGPAGLQAKLANNVRFQTGLNRQLQQSFPDANRLVPANQNNQIGSHQPNIAQQQQQQFQNPLAQLFGMQPQNNNQFLPNQQQHQPMNPLQFLTGPFQAFLPQLNTQPQNSTAVNQKHLNNNKQRQTTTQPVANQNLLIPTNNQHQQAQNVHQQQQQQLPNLQSFYQQLPLYQALLAARQRQEALQAAEKLRQAQLQQHQQQQPPQHLSNQLGLLQQLRPPAPQQPANTNTNTNSNGLTTNSQQQDSNSGQSGQTQANKDAAAPANVANQENPNAGHVKFDDDEARDDNKPANNNQDADANSNNEDNNNQDNIQNNNNSNQQSDSDNNNDKTGLENEPENGANNGANENDGQPAKPEEEDPDLKQFQNFANGGDTFTDLFPKGVLDNNDITEINDEQKKQNKRNEEEERRKQQQQQQAQNQNQDVNQNKQDQAQNQPAQVGQFVNNNLNNDNANNNQPAVDNLSGNNNAQPDNQTNPSSGQSEPNEQSEGENGGGGESQGDSDQEEPEGGESEGESDEGGTNDPGEQNGPEAAALTAKPNQPNANINKLTSSPGVVYSKLVVWLIWPCIYSPFYPCICVFHNKSLCNQ